MFSKQLNKLYICLIKGFRALLVLNSLAKKIVLKYSILSVTLSKVFSRYRILKGGNFQILYGSN